MNLKQPQHFKAGYHLFQFPIPASFADLVREKNWNAIDQISQALVQPGGTWFELLQDFHEFNKIETMISVRDASNEWEEDGIWHDDGSRVFAFSLSLTEHAEQLRGGVLEVKNIETAQIQSAPTPAWGTAILFLTGRHGYLHRIRRVEAGVRTILVGWCSDEK